MSNCNCQKPPGGGIDCPRDNLAICRNENGECKGYCRAIPAALTRIEFDNWVLRMVKQDERTLHERLSYADEQILLNKQYTERRNGIVIVVRFDMPDYNNLLGLEQFENATI